MIVFSIIAPQVVTALTTQDLNDILNRHTYFNPKDVTVARSSCTPGPQDPASISNRLYVIGDSITVGMRDAGNLSSKLTDAGWQVTKINAVVAKDMVWGNQQLAADSDILAGSDAVLVGLGTNNVGDVITSGTDVAPGGKDKVKRYMQNIVDTIKGSKSSIKIYWTSFYGEGNLTTAFGTFNLPAAYGILNSALDEVAAANDIPILPWATSSEAAQYVPDNNVHPNGKYPEMANYITEQLGTATGVVSSAGGAAKVFVIGDSLTYGMTKLGDMLPKLATAGFNVSTNYDTTNTATLVRVKGASVDATGGIRVAASITNIGQHSGDVAVADKVVIALGTNVDSDFVNKIKFMIAVIKGYNSRPGLQIYWVNTYHTDPTRRSYTDINNDISTAINDINAADGKTTVTLIDYATAALADTGMQPGTDNVHLGGTGYKKKSDFVISKLGSPTLSGGGGTIATTNCCTATTSTLAGSDNEQKVFNFFVGKGYTKEQAAGIVGNMIHESGVQPMRLQYTASGVETHADKLDDIIVVKVGGKWVVKSSPDSAFPYHATALTDNSVGWGLVQWTPPNKMVGVSNAAGVSFTTIDTLDFQAEFLWKQLEGTAIGSNEKSAGDRLKATTTVTDASNVFAGYYERFQNSSTFVDGVRVLNLANPAYAARAQSAQQVLRVYGDAYVGASDASVNCPGPESTAPVPPTANGPDKVGTDGVWGWDLPREGSNPLTWFYSQVCRGCTPFPGAYTDFYGLSEGRPGGINLGTYTDIDGRRWPNTYLYGSQGAIQPGGCGPTSVAMVISNLTGRKVGADEVADWFVKNGWQAGAGTNSNAFGTPGFNTKLIAKYGVTARRISGPQHRFSSTDANLVASEIKKGGFVIGSFDNTSPVATASGTAHIITIRAVTSDGRFYFADTGDTNTKNRQNIPIIPRGVSRTPLTISQIGLINTGLYIFEKAAAL